MRYIKLTLLLLALSNRSNYTRVNFHCAKFGMFSCRGKLNNKRPRSKSEKVCEFDTSFQASFVLQSFEGVQKCKKTETLTAIMERIVKAEVGHRHGDKFNP